jgi:hypothetical protein
MEREAEAKAGPPQRPIILMMTRKMSVVTMR